MDMVADREDAFLSLLKNQHSTIVMRTTNRTLLNQSNRLARRMALAMVLDTDPGTDPGTVPAMDLDTDPGMDPDTDPGTVPGMDLGTVPDTDLGTVPDPGTVHGMVQDRGAGHGAEEASGRPRHSRFLCPFPSPYPVPDRHLHLKPS